MKIGILNSEKITDSMIDEEVELRETVNIARRNLILFAGVGLLVPSLVGCSLIRSSSPSSHEQSRNDDRYDNLYKEYMTQRNLLAELYTLILSQNKLRIGQLTSGNITIKNRSSNPVRGSLGLMIVDSMKLTPESSGEDEIYMPGKTMTTFRFTNGPKATNSGDKRFVAWTRNSSTNQGLQVLTV